MLHRFSYIFLGFTLFVVISMSLPFGLSMRENYLSVNENLGLTREEIAGAKTIAALMDYQKQVFEMVLDENPKPDINIKELQSKFQNEVINNSQAYFGPEGTFEVDKILTDILEAPSAIQKTSDKKEKMKMTIQFASHLRLFNEWIADKSKLSIDPDKESYYLMISIEMLYPNLMRSLLSLILSAESSERENKAFLSLQKHLFLDDLKSFTKALHLSILFSGDQYRIVHSIQSIPNPLTAKLGQFYLESELNSKNLRAFGSYLNTNIQQLNNELLWLLEKRIESKTAQRNEKLGKIFGTWILVLILVTGSTFFVLHARRKTQKILDQQRRQLEISSRLSSVGEIAASIGHEIMNPVMAIVGFSDLTRRKLESLPSQPSLTKINSYLDWISDSAQKISEIVNSMKNLIKEDKNSQYRNVQLNKICSDVIRIFKSRAEKESVEIVVNLESELITCFGSDIEIFQIISNLVGNSIGALKYSPEKIVQIDAHAHKDKIIIRVTDTGPGIPEQLKTKIFEPLFTTKVEGTGLGLQISIKLANKMNGSLSLVNSTSGACFELTLPKEISKTTNLQSA